jgi:hypothetical protein
MQDLNNMFIEFLSTPWIHNYYEVDVNVYYAKHDLIEYLVTC